MLTPYLDLHMHTTQSDGRLSPRELLDRAYRAGIRVMSITDHNVSTDLKGLRKYASSAFREKMTLIQGAEISAGYVSEAGTELELHIVALGFDPENPAMKALLAAHRPNRKPYIDAILKRLKEECGIDLGTYETIRARFPDARYVGRMLLAQLLVEGGYTASVDESFDIYLGSHGQRRAYVRNPLRYSDLETVVRTVLQAGGVPILAHLLYYDLDSGNRTGGPEKERLVRTFRETLDSCGGVGGMEVFYTRYTDPEERLYLLKMAEKHGLLISGGSDFHGQETWETLDHRTSCSACSDLLERLGIQVHYPLEPQPLYVLSGFSGVGKGTVCRELRSRRIGGKPVSLIQSCTSRAPRSPEDPYTFVTREEFAELARTGGFLECNNAYGENGYGTPAEAVKRALQNRQSPLLEIDCVGLTHLLTDGRINPGLVRSVFLVAEAAEVASRLCLRGTESREKIRYRLEKAMEECRYLELYDAVVENRAVADTVEAVIGAFDGASAETDFDSRRFISDMARLLAAGDMESGQTQT